MKFSTEKWLLIYFLNCSKRSEFLIVHQLDLDLEIFEIINGTIVPERNYPFLVRLEIFDSMCGASIQNEWSIVTAGHCLPNVV